VIKVNQIVIFLDIDGVLATPKQIHAWAEREHKPCPPGLPQIDPECANILKRIVDRLDAQIVVSSCWRKLDHDMYDLIQLFSKLEIPLLGVTPSSSSGIREAEIMKYIDDHHLMVDQCLVIDDDTHDLQLFTERLLQTDGYLGLQVGDDDRAESLIYGPFKKVTMTSEQYGELLSEMRECLSTSQNCPAVNQFYKRLFTEFINEFEGTLHREHYLTDRMIDPLRHIRSVNGYLDDGFTIEEK